MLFKAAHSPSRFLFSPRPPAYRKIDPQCLTMTSLRTEYLLFLAAFILLSAVPTAAEVVESVADCEGFLLTETPPQVPGILEDGNILDQNRYKPICQTYENQRRFLTLYDIENKIAVFSAYKYINEEDKTRPPNEWKIEPQLEKDGENKNMVDDERGKTYDNQASNSDYENSKGFDRGHLFPSIHASAETDKESTMTLTNIVPQQHASNTGNWKNMEDCIKCVMEHFCIDNNGRIEGFVVTGASPGTESLKEKVNIPSYLWSGFCCYNPRKRVWIASGHWGDNIPDGPQYLQSQTLTDLSDKLGGTNLFPVPECPTDKNLGQYPGIRITQTCSKCKAN